MTVRVRFAPSPTGYLHIGGARSALFTWMYARRHNGQFILRIEDTDQKRTVEGAIDYIMTSLRWLGLDWDEGPDIGGKYGPYIQTERRDLYQEWADWLVEHGHAYKCYCSPEELQKMREEMQAAGRSGGYDRRCRNLTADEIAQREAAGRSPVIRFKMPLDGQTVVPDLIRGDIVVDNEQIPDFVIMKSTGLPTYHLAHPVDDHFMEISHVTRGIEWLSTAPLHVRIFEAFGWEQPVYVHLPVILSPSGKGKLSKRTQAFDDSGQQVFVRVEEFRDAGYPPEAVVNFLANVGWSFGNDREKFTIEEAIARFDLAEVNPAETRLPYEKLDWLNGQYIQDMSPDELTEAMLPYLQAAGFDADRETVRLVAPAMSVRLKRFTDAVEPLRFLFEPQPLALESSSLTHSKLDLDAARSAFQQARDFLAGLEPFTTEAIGQGLAAIGEANTSNGKAGPFLGKMRLAVTGQKVSPPLYESVRAMGRERGVRRLDEIVAVLNGG